MKNIHKDLDKSLYNEKNLSLLNIRDLRDLGRKFGIPSPTTMKKQELIDYILKVVYGEVDAPARSSVGRPSVREFDINKCISKIKRNSDVFGELKNASLEDFGTMKLASYKEDIEVADIETRVYYEQDGKCYLRVRQFVESADDIKINKSLAEKFKLTDFDIVEIFRADDDFFKIISVNGIKVKSNFEKIIIGGAMMRAGISRDFYLSTKEEIKEEIEKLTFSCSENNIKLILFATKKYSGEAVQCIEYSEGEESSKLYKKVMTFIGLCEKAVFEGQDFIVAFESAEDIENMLDGFDSDISERIKKYLQTILPKFASLGNISLMFRCEDETDY